MRPAHQTAVQHVKLSMYYDCPTSPYGPHPLLVYLRAGDGARHGAFWGAKIDKITAPPGVTKQTPFTAQKQKGGPEISTACRATLQLA